MAALPDRLRDILQGTIHLPTGQRTLVDACTAYYHARSLHSDSHVWFGLLCVELLRLGVLPSGPDAPHTLIVDWGCGTGSLLLGLNFARTVVGAVPLAADKVEYIGVDNDRSRVDLARSVAQDLEANLPIAVDFDEGGEPPGFSLSPGVTPTRRAGYTVVHFFANAWRQVRHEGRGEAQATETALTNAAWRSITDVARFRRRHSAGASRCVAVHVLTTSKQASSHGISARIGASAMRNLLRQVEAERGGRTLFPCPHAANLTASGCPRPAPFNHPPHPPRGRELVGPSSPPEQLAAFCVDHVALSARQNLRNFVLAHTLPPDGHEGGWTAYGPDRLFADRTVHTEGGGTRVTCELVR